MGSERNIRVVEIDKVFKVKLFSANKAQYTKSYPQATACCSKKAEGFDANGVPNKDTIAKVSRKLVCSGCGVEVPTKTPWRVIGSKSDAFLMPAKVFEELEGLVESGELMVNLCREIPSGLADRFDALEYGVPVEEHESAYAELCALLKGRYAVGSGVFGSAARQFFLSVGDDNVLRLRKLTDVSQHNAVEPVVLAEPAVSSAVLAVEQRVVEKKMMNTWEYASWKNDLLTRREDAIEQYALTGQLPTVAADVKASKEQDELARLNALLEGE